MRGDKGSAGYDFYSKDEQVILQPGQSHLFWTDVCAYMQEDEVLLIHVRSSIGIKKGLMLKNTTGIIDSSLLQGQSKATITQYGSFEFVEIDDQWLIIK